MSLGTLGSLFDHFESKRKSSHWLRVINSIASLDISTSDSHTCSDWFPFETAKHLSSQVCSTVTCKEPEHQTSKSAPTVSSSHHWRKNYEYIFIKNIYTWNIHGISPLIHRISPVVYAMCPVIYESPHQSPPITTDEVCGQSPTLHLQTLAAWEDPGAGSAISVLKHGWKIQHVLRIFIYIYIYIYIYICY